MDKRFYNAVTFLKDEFNKLQWKRKLTENESNGQLILKWPGDENESIIVNAFNGYEPVKVMHRHDYFYFWFMYDSDQEDVKFSDDSVVTLKRNDFFIGQPFASHVLTSEYKENSTVIGVLMKKETVYRYFVPAMSNAPDFLNFFLQPSLDSRSADKIYFNIKDDYHLRKLIEVMVVEYAEKKYNYQENLLQLTQAFITEALRQYMIQTDEYNSTSLYTQIVNYINSHLSSVNLNEISQQFSYHPNYISTLIKKECGITFSRILLKQRMERAVILLKGTDLSIEQIARIVGYSNPSNFHKAFKSYYNVSPREYSSEG